LMTFEQTVVFATLALALGLFLWGRWRYDVVAVIALLLVTITGIVPAAEAFAGFGHPAVITVAAVLVISRGLINSGLIDIITSRLFSISRHSYMQVGALTTMAACLSSVMNNVGALAIMLPVAMQIARRNGTPPSLLLMPIAFGSLLGGVTTMIGTPPNVIISLARTQTGAPPFAMFDFSPVGVGVALAGVAFVSCIGWRLLPIRKGQGSPEEIFHIEDYLTEVRLTGESTITGWKVAQLSTLKDLEINILWIVRGKRRILSPSVHEVLEENDVLVVEAASDDLHAFINTAKLKLVGNEKLDKAFLGSEEVGLCEAVVMASSMLNGKTAIGLNLRRRYGVNLLAVARKGERLTGRLAAIRFQTGDILLFSGPVGAMHETLQRFGCIPLAARNLRIGQRRRVVASIAVFLSAIGLVVAGVLQIQVALVCAAVVMVFANIISVREIYDSIDWSVIVLLGAMIPVGAALETSGAAQRIALAVLELSGTLPPAVTLVMLLVGTMLLSDVINNAATAVLMAPIAISLAQGLGVSADPFLMTVALGASCAFLTPVGHQSNTLVMGPGGYRFGDYWRMGLPLDVLIVCVGAPLILLVWPL
jgi:di/tricarboxylate transporter